MGVCFKTIFIDLCKIERVILIKIYSCKDKVLLKNNASIQLWIMIPHSIRLLPGGGGQPVLGGEAGGPGAPAGQQQHDSHAGGLGLVSRGSRDLSTSA